MTHSSSLQTVCNVPVDRSINENNEVGDVVVTITAEPGVTVTFNPDHPGNLNNPFRLNEYQLLAAEVLDYEVLSLKSNSTIEFQTYT